MTVVSGMPRPGRTDVGVPDEQHEPTVFSVRGDLDACSAPGLRSALRAALRSAVGPPMVILDLSEVAFIDSVGLGVVMGGIRGVHERRGHAVVVARPGPVLGLLSMVGVSRMAPVLTAFDDAQAHLSREAAAHGGPRVRRLTGALPLAEMPVVPSMETEERSTGV